MEKIVNKYALTNGSRLLNKPLKRFFRLLFWCKSFAKYQKLSNSKLYD